ncbi:response regulator [Candidatus Latescibacterota bacterium]
MAKVMVVDDSKLMRKVLIKILQDNTNLEVVADAADGLEAYKKFKQFRPDLVTMDMTMPVMNGVDSLIKILSEFPDAIIVMVSAMNKKHMVINAIKNGAKSFILKPINTQKILEVVKEFFGENAIIKAGSTTEAAYVGKKDKSGAVNISSDDRMIDNFLDWIDQITDVEYYELVYLWKTRVIDGTLEKDDFAKKVKVVFDTMD